MIFKSRPGITTINGNVQATILVSAHEDMGEKYQSPASMTPIFLKDGTVAI